MNSASACCQRIIALIFVIFSKCYFMKKAKVWAVNAANVFNLKLKSFSTLCCRLQLDRRRSRLLFQSFRRREKVVLLNFQRSHSALVVHREGDIVVASLVSSSLARTCRIEDDPTTIVFSTGSRQLAIIAARFYFHCI